MWKSNAMVYVRTDKNGTKIYHDFTCCRCGGRGVIDCYIPINGGECYECFGSGKAHKPQIIKEYTPEYRAKLDVRRQARQQKQQEEALQKNVAGQAEWLTKKGFTDGKIHVVTLKDTFQVKDQIKDAGGRYDALIGWYLPAPTADFPTVELTSDECFEQDAWGRLQWKPAEDLKRLIKSKMPKEPESEWIGQVGDKVNMEVTYTKCHTYETHFTYYGETHYIHQFTDSEGNVLVWKTSNGLGDVPTESKVQIKGTIKGHDEYNGVKQTTLTRCKIISLN
jgi:hypothetical protein